MSFDDLIKRTGWSPSRVGAEFDIQQGKAVSAKWRTGRNERPFLRTRNVLWDDLDLSDLDRMEFGDTEASRLALVDGDLLTCEGGDIGRTAMWCDGTSECLYQNHLHRLRRRSERINPRFALHWLRAAFTVLDLYGGAGNKTTIPNLSAARLRDLPMPVPHRTTQDDIAAVLDTARDAIQAQALIVRGYEKLRTEVIAERLADQSESVALSECVEEMRYGTSVRCEPQGAGLPVLRIPNVVKEEIDLRDLKFADLSSADRSRYGMRSGDLLFVRTNGSREYIGRCAVYEDRPTPAAFASYLIRVRLRAGTFNPKYVRTYLSSAGREQILMRATPAADGKFNLDTGALRALEIPLVDEIEQAVIADMADEFTARIGAGRAHLLYLEELYEALLADLMTGAQPAAVAGERR
jgi:type I restriction enzyme S subunit